VLIKLINVDFCPKDNFPLRIFPPVHETLTFIYHFGYVEEEIGNKFD
jgi:hypothetical protein